MGGFVFSILLFLTLMKKNNQLTPGSDSTIRSLATHTKEECALGNVIPVYSNLLKGALERIMRLFFCINIEFWGWLALDNFPFVLLKLVTFSGVFFSAARNDRSNVGFGTLPAALFFSPQKMKFYNAFAS